MLLDQFIQAKEGLEPVWQEIQEGKQTVSLEGISGSGKAFFLALLFRRTSRSILVLTPDSTSAREFYEDLAFFLNPPLKKRGSAHGTGKELTLLEATAVYVKEAYFFHEIPFPIGPSLEAIGNRLDTLEQLLSCRKILTVSSTAAVLRRVLPRKVLAKTTTLLEVKGLQELGELEEIAIERGYRRVDEVEDRGEFAVRGGIFDIYTPGYANPLRIELNDDEIESIREFDLASQKSIRLLEKARLLPIREFFSDSGKERETIFDYLPDDGLIVLDDVSSIYQQVRRLWDLAQEDRRCSSDPPAPAQQAFNGKPTGNTASLYLDTEEIQLYLEEFQTLHLFPLGPTKEEEEEKIHSLTAEPVGHYQGRFADLARQLLQWQREKYNITLACLSRGQSVRLKSLLEEYGVSSTSASDSIPIRLIEKTFLPWTDTHDVSTNSGPFPIRISQGVLDLVFHFFPSGVAQPAQRRRG